MADLPRKTFIKSNRSLDENDPKPCPDNDCKNDLPRPQLPLLPPHPPLPPPHPPSSSTSSFSPFLIFLFCGLAVSFAFICYLTLTAKHRRRHSQRRHQNPAETHEEFVNEDLGPAVHHPIWLIQTVGLDPSEIESIQVFKYKKGESLIEGTDCSVCLSEFEEDESLRLLPKCSHAFHVRCIDTWLRSHKNCPLCRAPIVKNSVGQIETTSIDLNPMEPASIEEIGPGEDSETLDHHVVEIEINGEEEKTLETRRSVLMDESSDSDFHLHDQETYSGSGNQSLKKPNSMPKNGNKLRGSSSSIHRCSESSSFRKPFRKTSSFTNKFPQNRSY